MNSYLLYIELSCIEGYETFMTQRVTQHIQESSG